MAGNVPDWARKDYKKSSSQKISHGVQERPIFHGEHHDNPLTEEKKHTAAAFYADGGVVRGYADGMLVDSSGAAVRTSVGDPSSPLYIDPETRQLKREGIAAAQREYEESTKDMGALDKFVSGLKRTGRAFTSGNIDDPKSEAYWSSGAGRGQRERDKIRDAQAVEDGRANAGPREGDVDQWAAARKPMTTNAPSATTPVPVDTTVTEKPSSEYNAKKAAITGNGTDRLPRAEGGPRPMWGDSTEASVNQQGTRTNENQVSSSNANASNNKRKKSKKNKNSKSNEPTVPAVPADNNSRPSKPTPQSVDNDNRPSRTIPESAQNNRNQSNQSSQETNNQAMKAMSRQEKLDKAEALRQQYFIARNVYNKKSTPENKRKYEALRDAYRAIEAELRKK
jgi:hypothetical protein